MNAFINNVSLGGRVLRGSNFTSATFGWAQNDYAHESFADLRLVHNARLLLDSLEPIALGDSENVFDVRAEASEMQVPTITFDWEPELNLYVPYQQLSLQNFVAPLTSNVEVDYLGAKTLAWRPEAWDQINELFSVDSLPQIPSCVNPNVALAAIHDYITEVAPCALSGCFTNLTLAVPDLFTRVRKRLSRCIRMGRLTLFGSTLYVVPQFVMRVIEAVARESLVPLQAVSLARAHDLALSVYSTVSTLRGLCGCWFNSLSTWCTRLWGTLYVYSCAGSGTISPQQS